MDWHLDRAAISRIENGQRKVSVEDLLTLAAALSVPPTVLLFPPYEQYVDVAPGLRIPPHEGWRWLAGAAPLDNRAIEQWARSRAPLSIWEELFARREEVASADAELAYARHIKDEDLLSIALQRKRRVYEDLYRSTQAAIRQGISTPRWSDEVIDEWKAMGFAWPPDQGSRSK